MKRFLLSILGALIALSGIARDFTYEYEGQTLTYTVIDEDAKTCKTKDGKDTYTPGNNILGELIIPSVANDGDSEYTVTEVGDFAFSSCYGLTKVEISNYVTSIGDSAFSGCGLTSVIIPNSVITIGNSAFGSSGLASVTIGNSVTTIGHTAFSFCAGLVSITIPNSVTSIGESAFWCCSGLTSVEIGNAVTAIERTVFWGCSKLTSVAIGKSVTSLGSGAFYDCSNLTSVTIPNSVTSIGSDAFSGCTGLVSMTIPNSVTSIGGGTFSGCSSLTSVSIPNSVTSIGGGAFSGCSSLTSVTIPNSVTSIDSYTFSGCSSLTSVIIPPSVDTIEAWAFAGDKKLNTIAMGHRMKTIEEKAFDGCSASVIRITAQKPPKAPYDVFSNYAGKLYVQGEEAKEAYANAYTCWDRFNSVLMVEPTGIDMGDSPKSITGKAGDTFQLTATLMPDDVTQPQVFWHSTNPAIATVDHNGLVTLHADIVENSSVNQCKIIAESLYANGPVAEVPVATDSSGIENEFDNDTSGDIDFDAPIEVYNIQGVFVSDRMKNLAGGIYIVRQGKNVKKIMVK